MNDFQYQLSDLGRECARRLTQHCTYFVAAPVSLKDYVESVKVQSLTEPAPHARDLGPRLRGPDARLRILNRLGPAINSGRGLFCTARRATARRALPNGSRRPSAGQFGSPGAIGIDGEIIRVFDPVNHEELPLTAGKGLLDQRAIDNRWVRIVRPTIVVGGELTMAQLEVTRNATTGISEAPLQVKSNCGTLVIDDFGRQRMHVSELLNRWIVPLEKRRDFLNLPNGKNVRCRSTS